jgi:hypothetical protein
LKQGSNPYIWVGLGLLLTGALVAGVAYLILSLVWLTAFGLAMIVIAFILLGLALSVPRLSPELSRLLFETATDNLAVLLEELAVSTKAIYLPPAITGGKSHALIPLAFTPRADLLRQPLPDRLIVRYGNGAQELGLLVTTPGTAAVKFLGEKPEANAELLGAILSTFFNGTLGIADSVSVSTENHLIKVAFSHLRHERENDRTDQVLGSAPASVAAAVVAAAWDRPVSIISEGRNARKYQVVIELLK